ncbi:hypothetical protein KIW84_024326 [Lathyrus oleraceus]|uniref:Uncharacterized protein n=1 Tax=Pisum sativum TaxID=3888 RepID=A0A9D5BCQ1_PEA|nr:hypothetical protein KIW84_024326 [Pisum sativum]
MFLIGLNKDIDDVRGRVLGKVPLPTFCETFAEIIREESQQRIMMVKTPRSFESEGSTLASRNFDEGIRLDKIPWCDHCKCGCHTHETCWKLKGKPLNWKKKSGCVFQASNSDQGQHPPSVLVSTHYGATRQTIQTPRDLNSGKMISSAKESGGLYYLDIGSESQLP